MATRRGSGDKKHNVIYQRLSQDDSGFIDEQFKEISRPIPWKSVYLAVILLLVGTLLLVVGSLLVTGHIDQEYQDRMWPLLILGALMFIPGSYHSYISYYAFKGYDGYSFDSIPSFDN